MESALHRMSQANMELGVFQETKVTKGIYMQESSGYRVVATEALSANSTSVAVLYRAAEHFSVEALQTYGVNVTSFQLASGDQRRFILGCYLAPDDALTIEEVVAATSQRPWGAALLVVGDFNTELGAPEGC